MVNRRTSSPALVNRWFRVAGIIPIGVLVSGLAQAAPNDSAAEALSNKALFEDYLNLKFDAAASKLKEAVTLCESGCSEAVSAKMYRNLGVVLIAGKEDREGAISAFTSALKADPSISLDADLSTPEIESAFEEARGNTSAESGAAASVNIEHKPPGEQKVNTPLPLFVTAGAGVAKMSTYVQGVGAPDFTEFEMTRVGDGFELETSCAEVGTEVGELRYYIVAMDEEDDPVGKSGSAEEPIVVLIKEELEGDAPSLPDAEPPEQCSVLAAAASADCPPDFPGCGKGDGSWGDDLNDEEDDDKHTRHWFSLGFQTDLLLMPADDDTCSPNRDDAYQCFYSDGSYRNPIFNDAGYQQSSGKWVGAGTTAGGFNLATLRILLGYDYALTEKIRIGARVGFAFGGRPTVKTFEVGDNNTLIPVSKPAFIPVHGEARAEYWFGTSESAFRPYVGVSAGLAQIDSKLVVEIIDADRAEDEASCPHDAQGNIINKQCSLSKVEVWNSTGPGFAAGSAGVMVPLGEDHGINVEAKLFATFGLRSGFGTSLQAGYMLGL